jgi:hypothetical protein
MEKTRNRLFTRAVVCAITGALVLTFTSFSYAQSEAARAIYNSAANITTNIKGIRSYPAPPANFSAVTASDEQLAGFGFPPRPDKTAQPEHYAQWERAMRAARTRASGDLDVKSFSSRSLMMSKQPGVAAAAPAPITAPPTHFYSYNWAGVASTNKVKVFNPKYSFQDVYSVFNVPAAQPPIDACANGITGPFYEVSWNGLDGVTSGDVLQGGSLSAADCNGQTLYEAWVEWFPSYPIIGIFPVTPGDDMYVETFDFQGGTNPGNVYVEDLTSGVFLQVSLTWVSGPGLVGDSAEWIVERPCCNADSFPLPLARTVYEFFNDSFAATGVKQFWPGSTAAATLNFSMVDDGATQVIEDLAGVGVGGFQGKSSIWFTDKNCADSGGCTPF